MVKRICCFMAALTLIFASLSVPAFAASGDDSGSMVVSGITHSLTGKSFVTADSGYIYYNGVLTSVVPTVSGYSYFLIASSPTSFADLYLSKYPFVISSDGSDEQVYPATTSFTTIKRYMYNPMNKTWNFYQNESSKFGSWGGGVVYKPFYSNHNIYFWDVSSNKITSTVVYEEGSTSFMGEATKTFSYSGSVSSVFFDYGIVMGRSASLADEIFSNLTYSGSFSNPYVDFNFPLSTFTGEILELYDGITLDGSLAFDFAAGLAMTASDSGKTDYIISDLIPSSFQILINGSPCENTTQYPFNTSSRNGLGHLQLSNQSLDFMERASISTGKIAADDIETIGFRIYLTSSGGNQKVTFSNSITYSSVQPYIYANFNQVNGSLGLPALTFHEVEPEPDPSPEPSEDPDPEPSVDPSPEPSEDPDPEPSVDPSPEPSEDPDPEPSIDPSPKPSEDPDPEPSFEPSPDPEVSIPPEMELLGSLLGKTVSVFQFEFTIFGFTMSFWRILLFVILAGIAIALIRRFTQ